MPAMASRGRGRRTINEINMVPFIDVMLVLLIIFMVTAPLITPSTVDLPSIGKANKQPDRVIQIVVGKDETLQIKTADRTAPTTMRDVANAVRQADATATTATAAAAGSATSAVVISADRSVKYETVVKVMDTLQRAGVQRVGLSVQLAP
ncbi:biopolymer transporter ExbD [Xylophilus ampelinus]|uniref:Cell division and transport-associated protein TolR n=1 Tax=Xylophilus ampelinus TaxID=54067 RepID=A0A318SZP8_9BURK|nr:biopolymer transporter ExbD [Xylophilus ampelinus]MCS4509851.1 biopolymer transporter ExbD [Xylophilus ampelinus]PYE78598.1 cell division and transport-associated protein TolR [Xylophilus ampelinus]